MRVIENPGRSIEVETGARKVIAAERVSAFVVAFRLATREMPQGLTAELDHREGMVLLRGLAELYGCHVTDR